MFRFIFIHLTMIFSSATSTLLVPQNGNGPRSWDIQLNLLQLDRFRASEIEWLGTNSPLLPRSCCALISWGWIRVPPENSKNAGNRVSSFYPVLELWGNFYRTKPMEWGLRSKQTSVIRTPPRNSCKNGPFNMIFVTWALYRTFIKYLERAAHRCWI